MRTEDLKGRIEDLMDPLLRSMGIELVDVEFKRGPSRSLLRLFVDRDTGVSIEDCAHVSREAEALLDVEDLIPGSYTLEVSSPGLDRPLKSLGDFRRFTGRLAKVTLREAIDGRTHVVGRIMAVEGDRVSIDVDGQTLLVSYGNVKKARLEVEF